MVELGEDVVINFTNEDFDRIKANLEADLITLRALTAPPYGTTASDEERKNWIIKVLKRFNKAIQIHVPLSDLHVMGVQPPHFNMDDTYSPEGVLVWAVTIQPWDVRYFTKEGFLREKKKLQAKIDKAKKNSARKKVLEAELRKYLKAL